MPYDNKKKKKKEKETGFFEGLFGGLTGKAEEGIRKRPSKMEQAEQEAMGKKKKKKKKAKDARNSMTYE